MTHREQAWIAGAIFIAAGLIHYFYRKGFPLSESTLDELERDSFMGWYYTPQYGFFIVALGVIILGLGYFADTNTDDLPRRLDTPLGSPTPPLH